MRTFYSSYIQHCMRFYARHSEPNFRSDADKRNWESCEDAIKTFTDNEQDILLTIYRDGDSLEDSIRTTSIELGVNRDMIWKLVNELEKKIAKRRNLI